MVESQSKSIEELKKSEILTDQFVNASREVFEELGTPEDTQTEKFRHHNLFEPNLITKFLKR